MTRLELDPCGAAERWIAAVVVDRRTAPAVSRGVIKAS